MKKHEELLLADALQTAIEAERKNIKLKRVIALLSVADIVALLYILVR